MALSDDNIFLKKEFSNNCDDHNDNENDNSNNANDTNDNLSPGLTNASLNTFSAVYNIVMANMASLFSYIRAFL